MKLVYTSMIGAALLGMTATAQAGALVPNKTVSIAFSGFCDGLRLVINQTSGLVTGSRIGCVTNPLIGTVGANAKSGAGVTVGTSDSGGSYVFVVDDVPQAWAVYAISNGALINSGTYTVGAPARQDGGRRSTSP